MDLYLTFVLTGIAVGVLLTLVYLTLRLVRGRRLRRDFQSSPADPSATNSGHKTPSALRSALNHSWWTAVIALFLCGAIAPRPTVYEVSAQIAATPELTIRQFDMSTWMAGNAFSAMFWLSVPMIALAAIYVLAQFSWPRPVSTIRTATLDRRSLAALLPRKMAALLGTNLILFLTFGMSTLWFPGVDPQITFFGPNVGSISDGVAPGWFLIMVFGISLLVLVAAVGGALAVISNRRIIPGLSFAEDARIRTIDMNRMLRWAVLLASSTILTLANISWGRDIPAVGIAATILGLLNAVLSIGFFRSPTTAQPVSITEELDHTPLDKLRPGTYAYAIRWQQLASTGTAITAFIAVVLWAAMISLVTSELPGNENVGPALLVSTMFILVLLLPLLFLLVVARRFAALSRGEAALPYWRPHLSIASMVLLGLLLVTATVAIVVTAPAFDQRPVVMSWVLIAANLAITTAVIFTIARRKSYFSSAQTGNDPSPSTSTTDTADTTRAARVADHWLRSASFIRVIRCSAILLAVSLLPLAGARLGQFSVNFPILPDSFASELLIPLVMVFAIVVLLVVRIRPLELPAETLSESWKTPLSAAK